MLFVKIQYNLAFYFSFVYFIYFVDIIDITFDNITAQKIMLPIKDFFCKCDLIHRKLRIWSYLLMKSLMENFILVHCIMLIF